MTTLQLASDIHLETRQKLSHSSFNSLIRPSAAVLALVGDIGDPAEPVFSAFLAWCSSKFELVLFVHGNHELYSSPSNSVLTVDARIALIQNICNQFRNVVYLNNKKHIYNGVWFIGSTLWSYVPSEHKTEIELGLNDYHYIFKSADQTISVDDTNGEFAENKKFLEGFSIVIAFVYFFF
ncbi:hypothetical protein HK100_009167 [Physocladia obscura]|uniref:Calcineurin-like phosphoesterase domain-containing protein n=1 Tax=Physocladia obscura TaxID=109957 RepID=A0AAD5T3G5_9FUNG|nr:hypothetical protein HK100_009167 [Physocladia obscura]